MAKSEKNVEIEEKEVETMNKEKEESMIKKTIKFILNAMFWITIIGLLALWITEALNVRADKDPLICMNKEIHEYEDGIVTECNGIGYKTFHYEREGFGLNREFGPFFIKVQE